MTERTEAAARTGGATREQSAAAAAGQTPTDRPAAQRDADDVPLSEGVVRNGGAFMAGTRPGDAVDAGDEPRQPLDSREAFGGDGARFVDPVPSRQHDDPARQARLNATYPGEDGAEPNAARVDQDRD